MLSEIYFSVYVDMISHQEGFKITDPQRYALAAGTLQTINRVLTRNGIFIAAQFAREGFKAHLKLNRGSNGLLLSLINALVAV